MHYRLRQDIIIKTENAAKPACQGSRHLKRLISNLPRVEHSFDYGCGKLRYHSDILKSSDLVSIIDSEVQISRQQIIKGQQTSIRKITAGSNSTMTYNDVEFQKLGREFDRGFCINVLSVIPIIKKRREVLTTILNHLKPGASCLFVVQYRNSDFSRMKKMKNARPWRDGFLIDSLRGFSFYGLIPPPNLVSLIRTQGFQVERLSLNQGSAFLWASRRSDTRQVDLWSRSAHT